MRLAVLLLICGAKCLERGKPILTPQSVDVFEQSSVELTCIAHMNETTTQWGTFFKKEKYSDLTFSEEGECSKTGFLRDTKYFETECYSNATFIVRIIHANVTNHGQEWYCSSNFSKSNTAFTTVQGIIYVVENMKYTITCDASEGRPVAGITVKQTLHTRQGTRILNGIPNDISTTGITSVKDQTRVHSSIDIIPKREDNNSRLICVAKNGNDTEGIIPSRLIVQYPPSKPIFVIGGESVNGSFISLISGSNVSILCQSDSYPLPTYHWNSTGRSEDGPYQNLSSLVKNETWQCTSTNHMKLPNETKINGTNSSIIKINIFYPSEIDMFYAIGKGSEDNVDATENETVIFKCSVNSIPLSEIVIYFAEKELRRDKYTHTLHESHRITSCLDDGVYICEAKNQYNSQPSLRELNLSVNCTPLISPDFNMTTNVTCSQSETITLQFKAIANPTPQFYWLKQRGSSWKSLESSTKYDIHTAHKHSNLTIRDVTTNDYGIYKLRIQNKIGSLEQLYFLKPDEIPTLTEKPPIDWMYIAYTCGGFILVLAALITIMCSRKRWLNQQSTARTVCQNVQFGVPETSGASQNLPYIPQTAAIDQNVLPTRKPEACKSKIKQKNRVSVPPQQLELDLEFDIEEPYTEASVYFYTMEIIKRLDKIKVAELYEYVRGRTDESFSADFQKIPAGFQMPYCYARKPENIAMNRFKGILPYDHTRVRVDEQPDFFINASYIDGYNGTKTYIACLGPTAATHDNFKTFWKMVWCERSELIIMLTNLNESSGMKCEQYWPDANEDEMYGDILVSCQKIEKFAEYTIRSFEVTRTTKAEKVCRNLIHLHYTAWPDKRTPEDVTSFLEFGQTFHDIRTTMSGPLIVHCSAGIGRTGVFIAIDKLIMEGKNEGSVNVVACITKMREQRVRMVQTSEQYKFIFQVLAYALNFDCKPIPIEKFSQQLEREMSDDGLFEKQYKELNLALEEESKEQIDCREKNRSNKDKNRQGADIPDDTNRVYLYQNRSYEDSDYINAVFINSYKCKDHFIMAQSPLPGTESDFLTLIYQENCFCVMSMDDCNDLGMKIGKYLLRENQSLDIGNFTVSCFLTDSKRQCIVRKVTIKNNDEFSKGERYFYHFQYKTWIAKNDIPPNVEEFVDFVKDVQEYAELGDDSSHVLAHCLNANERSGLFCAIAIIREKLYDEQVSILNTLRHLRTRRPSAITSLDQLKFCYKAAVAMAEKQHERIYINDQNII